MYDVDDRDRVRALDGLPQSSVGAPLPMLLCNEHTVIIAYLVQDSPEGWDGSSVRLVGPETERETVAVVTFSRRQAHYFGSPNDEAFHGHPLAERGLRPYGSFVVERSSWVRRLERMNSVHPYHDAESFRELTHFVLSFHDSTFECVARSFEVEVHSGSILSAIPRMVALLSA